MPVATSIFMAPGMPQMLNGQEVGFGKGMGAVGEPDLNVRRRGIIDWNFEGRELLTPHYQKLAQFPAFSQHKNDTNSDGNVDSQDKSDFDRIETGNGIVYSFLRPYNDSNGLTAMNFSNVDQNVTLDLTNANLNFSDDFNPSSSYWVNDLYNGTSTQVQGSELSTFAISLTPYDSTVYTISIQEEMVDLPILPPIVKVQKEVASLPKNFELFQNYPNPFNPTTIINFSMSNSGKVRLKIFDVLGREILSLVDEHLPAGTYSYKLNGNDLSSGVYFYRLTVGKFSAVKKLSLLK